MKHIARRPTAHSPHFPKRKSLFSGAKKNIAHQQFPGVFSGSVSLFAALNSVNVSLVTDGMFL
jgi:hypothetical protein